MKAPGVHGHRYRCTVCERTFQVPIDKIERTRYSLRLRHLAALTWALGLSLRNVEDLFEAFDVPLSRMTIWRDGHRIAAALEAQAASSGVCWGGRYHRGNRSQRQPDGVAIAIDPGQGGLIAVATLDERDPAAVLAWLEPLVRELGLEAVVVAPE